MDETMKEEQHDRVYEFLKQVDDEICQKLKNRKESFPSFNQLLNKFNQVKLNFEKQGSNVINEIAEITNELCIANIILSDQTNICKNLDYEPKPERGGKSIDFRVQMDDGRTIYCDVKTIHPEPIDNWETFEKQKNFLPENNEMILFETEKIKNKNGKVVAEYGLGGLIWHQWFTARSRMLEYTLELEEKINNYDSDNTCSFFMTFCSNGSDWGLDRLEDFSGFYITGRHYPGDDFSEMEDFYIKDKKLKLLRNVSGFCYFERKVDEIEPKMFIYNVRRTWQR